MSYTKTETATTAPSRRKDAPGLPRLIVDTREQMPLCFEHLEAVRGTLATGDYSIEGMEGAFMVERKSVQDLVGSLTQGRERFFRELERMRAAQCARLLIVGKPVDLANVLHRRNVTAESIAGSLAAINARFVPVVWAPSPELAAQMVERWAVYFWAGAARPFLGRVDVPAWCREGVLDNMKG